MYIYSLASTVLKIHSLPACPPLPHTTNIYNYFIILLTSCHRGCSGGKETPQRRGLHQECSIARHKYHCGAGGGRGTGPWTASVLLHNVINIPTSSLDPQNDGKETLQCHEQPQARQHAPRKYRCDLKIHFWKPKKHIVKKKENSI